MLKRSRTSEPSAASPATNSVGARRANAHRNLTREDALTYRPLSEVVDVESANQRKPLEIELKLDVSPEHIDMLKCHPLFRKCWSSGKRELISVYLDTKDRDFRRRGLSFRLRRKDGRLLQTIKGTYRGVLERTEREATFNWVGDDQHGSIETVLKQLKGRKLPTALKPIFKTRIERETYQIGGVEVCLDKGEIIAGRLSAPVAEIELELKNGHRAALFALARQISAIIPAGISIKSKSERGYDLLEGAKHRAVMAQETVLSRSATVTEAFHTICNECLYHLISNKSGVRAFVSEPLHQSRVALRRFDAVVKLFRQIASGQAAKEVAEELKWIGDELAPARELDVFLAEALIPFKKKHPGDPEVAEIRRACIQRRKKEYERANAALASERFCNFVLDAAEWIDSGKWQAKARPRLKREQLAKSLVSEELSKLRSKMKTGRRIEELNLRRLHKLRLRAKRMRYTIEFAKGIYDKESNRKRIDKVLTTLGNLQAALGRLNDIASGKAILERIAAERKFNRKNSKSRRTSRLATMIFGDEERVRSKQLDKAAKAFDKLENIKPFWT
jgi:inorganic triphosphatase YgiF